MSEEERKFLKSTKRMTPSFEVFKKMVAILANIQEKTDQLLKTSILGKA